MISCSETNDLLIIYCKRLLYLVKLLNLNIDEMVIKYNSTETLIVAMKYNTHSGTILSWICFIGLSLTTWSRIKLAFASSIKQDHYALACSLTILYILL